MSTPAGRYKGSTRGFARTSSLLKGRIRDASASRGFAQSRVLTHWEEIAGPDTARISRPVEITYAKGGFGATLVLLTTGSNAPILEMEKEALRARVNAVYGYNAIARIRITQTAPTGFADGKVSFDHAPKKSTRTEAQIEADAATRRDVAPVKDQTLRNALAQLGAHIKSRRQS